MLTVDDDLFGDAARIAGPLTPQLCSYWVERLDAFGFWALRPEVLQNALEDPNLQADFRRPIGEFLSSRREVPHQVGDCNVIFVLDADSSRDAALLRRSFILPFQWNRGLWHGDNLPPGLLQVAEQVRTDLGGDVKGQWGLSLNERAGLSHVDMSGLTGRTLSDCSSAWGALAAGLLLASVGGRPRGDVFVSAAWKPGVGLQEVKGIAEKLAVASEFGCKVFYASLSRPDAQRLSHETTCPGVEVRGLVWGKRAPAASLRDLLHEMEYPPLRKDGAGFEARCRYANGFRFLNREAREDYILKNIVLDHACQLREKWGELGVERLVILMSSLTAALLSLLVLRPKHALIVHTERDRGQHDALLGHIQATAEVKEELRDCRLSSCCVDVCAFTTIEATILEFLSPGQGASAVDVTGGTSGMTAAATLAASGARAFIFHVLSKQEDYLPLAGTGDLKFVRGPAERA